MLSFLIYAFFMFYLFMYSPLLVSGHVIALDLEGHSHHIAVNMSETYLYYYVYERFIWLLFNISFDLLSEGVYWNELRMGWCA